MIKKNIIEDTRTPDFVKQSSKDAREDEMVKAFDANHAETRGPCDDCGKTTFNLHAASGIRLCDYCTTRKK